MPLEELSEESTKHDLGLTMIERIIETHQGFIKYTSEAGGAAMYTVWLPMDAEVEMETSDPLPSDAKAATTLEHRDQGTLLMVDDEEGLLETMASSLRDRGYEVITATDGESALLEYREHARDLDLVITDLVLPGLSGWEVFTAIRRAAPDLPVLIMSGHLEPKLEAAVNRSGAAGFLQKPFGLNLLLNRVRELLGKRAPSDSGARI
jgi:CheY-like chemotaxis protein